MISDMTKEEENEELQEAKSEADGRRRRIEG